MGRLIALIRQHWKKILVILGVSSLLDILKEYLRTRLTDWLATTITRALSDWLIGNPAAFLTSGVILVLLIVLGAALRVRLRPQQSVILDAKDQPFSSSRLSTKWLIGCILIVLAITTFIGFGAYRYYRNTHRAARPTLLAATTEVLEFDNSRLLKKTNVETPCSRKGHRRYSLDDLSRMPGGMGYHKPYLAIEPKTLKLQFTSNHNGYTELLLEVVAVNRGETSIAKDWRFCMVSDANKALWYEAEETEANKQDFIGQTSLLDVTSRPIPHGEMVKGWLLFIIPNETMQQFKYTGAVRCRDYLGTEYAIEFGPSE